MNDDLLLEQVIDRIGLIATIASLTAICAVKADHIRANWQDDVTASAWDTAADKLGKCARSLPDGL